MPHYAQHGYQKTAFTRHAPTVLTRITEFERGLLEGLDDAGLAPDESRSDAINRIDELLVRTG